VRSCNVIFLADWIEKIKAERLKDDNTGKFLIRAISSSFKFSSLGVQFLSVVGDSGDQELILKAFKEIFVTLQCPTLGMLFLFHLSPFV
jgi:hypothetical protein